jgi:hypothetical protein
MTPPRRCNDNIAAYGKGNSPQGLAVKPTNSDETPLFFLFYWIIEVGPQHDYP